VARLLVRLAELIPSASYPVAGSSNSSPNSWPESRNSGNAQTQPGTGPSAIAGCATATAKIWVEEPRGSLGPSANPGGAGECGRSTAWGKPDEGEPHVRFGKGEQETGLPPRLLPLHRLDVGGNDYPVKAMGIRCFAVENWQDTAIVIRGMIQTFTLSEVRSGSA